MVQEWDRNRIGLEQEWDMRLSRSDRVVQKWDKSRIGIGNRNEIEIYPAK